MPSGVRSRPRVLSPPATMSNTPQNAAQLIACVEGYQSCAVAFSAGVDSTVVAKAAQLALGDRALAVTGVGPALAEGELEESRQLAALIRIQHVEVPTAEITQPGYIANGHDRCYHCKTELYTHVERVARERGLSTIANGANIDDQGDYRPGMQAAKEFAVHCPLVECGFDKAAVRDLAAYWSLPVADKPASPCLASRIAYGQEVTPERLRRIDLAEQHLRSLGLREVRVRLHAGELARIEAPAELFALLADSEVRQEMIVRCKELGFKFVTLDVAGFQSGSLNTLIPVEALNVKK